MSGIEELHELEQTCEYLFHGSDAADIEEFELRQPVSDNKPDGEPCVAAAEFIEPAIFMAIIGSRKAGGWDSNKAGRFGFFVDKDSWQKASTEKWHGYVYVLQRHDFARHRNWEWRAHSKVKPVAKVPVNFSDLPQPIEVLQ